MKKYALWAVIACWGLGWMGCDTADDVVPMDEVPMDSVYMLLELEYVGERNQTTARVSFSLLAENEEEGTDYLSVGEDDVLRFDGNKMKKKGGKNRICYEYCTSGALAGGTFSWETAGGAIYENSVQMNDIAFPADTVNLDSTGFEMPWVGLPVQANESVSLRLLKDLFAQYYAGLGDVSVSVPKNKLDKMYEKHGDYGRFRFIRTAAYPLQQGTMTGGKIRVSYKTDGEYPKIKYTK